MKVPPKKVCLYFCDDCKAMQDAPVPLAADWTCYKCSGHVSPYEYTRGKKLN